MNLIRSNYLEQMTEELEIINYHLDRIYREAASRADTTPVTLLESEDASCFAEYAKAIDEANSRICNAASYFVESVFSNSGEKFTPDEARNIIKTISEGKPDDINKPILRKALYLIAGLSKTINATEITRAIKGGNTLEYVMKNAKKLNLNSIPDDATFRVCVGKYTEEMDIRLGLIKSILSDIDSVKAMTESVSNDSESIAAMCERLKRHDIGKPDEYVAEIKKN